MKSFNHFELQDFLEDESFRQWVFGEASAEVAQWWNEFLLLYPEKAGLVTRAKELLLALQSDTFILPVPQAQQNIRQILRDTEPSDSVIELPWYRSSKLWWAAASVLLFVSTWALWHRRHVETPMYNQLVAESEAPVEEVVNNAAQPRLVLLADGSSVLLQPNSRISYPKQFNHHRKREVYLMGEAFFEVAKNPQKPFFVYADNLITKVLGTSFTVRAFQQEAVRVTVKTGKVSVFSRADHARAAKEQSRDLIGMVLTPNQRVLYEPHKERLLRSLVESPALLAIPIQRPIFEFQARPVAEVFATLEKAYGVEILFDAEVMKNCLLTASLDDEPLFEKLNLICQTLDARYEQMDAKILITSNGCP